MVELLVLSSAISCLIGLFLGYWCTYPSENEKARKFWEDKCNYYRSRNRKLEESYCELWKAVKSEHHNKYVKKRNRLLKLKKDLTNIEDL